MNVAARLEALAEPGGIWFAEDSPLERDGFELPVPVRQAKLTRSRRRKTGPGKLVAHRRKVSVAQSSATADDKSEIRLGAY
jgi:hypothetical protein